MFYKIIEVAKIHTTKTIISTLIATVPGYLLYSGGWIIPIIAQLTLEQKKLVVAAIAALTLILLLTIAFLWPRLKLDKALMVYCNPNTNVKYCPTCKSKKVLSPLRETKDDYICQVKDCKTRIRKLNPHYGNRIHIG